jgi:hypothetical protein
MYERGCDMSNEAVFVLWKADVVVGVVVYSNAHVGWKTEVMETESQLIYIAGRCHLHVQLDKYAGWGKVSSKSFTVRHIEGG